MRRPRDRPGEGSTRSGGRDGPRPSRPGGRPRGGGGRRSELLDDLLRLCAAAGATPEVHHGVPERRG
ncbi:hypothetical protein ABZ322_39850, partial [Streptomyces sp. NPDC006129]